jgi:nicotinate dehydrogenase subunit A
MIMRTVALLEQIAAPSEAQIREALDYNLCRCGAHEEILQSVRHAVTLTEQQQGSTAPQRSSPPQPLSEPRQ